MLLSWSKLLPLFSIDLSQFIGLGGQFVIDVSKRACMLSKLTAIST